VKPALPRHLLLGFTLACRLQAAVAPPAPPDLTRQRTEVEALLQQAGAACLAAKIPEDLDVVIQQLAPYAADDDDFSPGLRAVAMASTFEAGRLARPLIRLADPALAQHAARAHRFVIRWQDCLALMPQPSRPRTEQAFDALLGLADVMLVPRSRLLTLRAEFSAAEAARQQAIAYASSPEAESARQQAELAQRAAKNAAISSATNEVLKAIRSAFDLAPALAKLSALEPPTHYLSTATVRIRRLLEQLLLYQSLIENRDATLENAPVPLVGWIRDFPQEEIPDGLDTIRRMIGELELKAAGMIFAEIKISPGAAELPVGYLGRVLAEAVRRENWPLVLRVLSFWHQLLTADLAELSPSYQHPVPRDDLAAYEALVKARHAELAGDVFSAVHGYQRALSMPGAHIPAEAIGRRLAGLAKTSPEPFFEATRSLLEQPSPPPVGLRPSSGRRGGTTIGFGNYPP